MTIVRAQLHRLYSPDVPDLEHYAPEDAENFGILVQAMVGPENGPGEESFDFLACTPRWLATQVAEADSGYLFGRHYLFLSRYDYLILRQAIHNLCNEAEGNNWQAVAGYLSRYGQWEFEDYSP